MKLKWTREEARLFHLYAVGLIGKRYAKGAKGIAQCFDDLGTLQLDPLPIMGRSHDLVMQARVDGTHPGDALDLIHKKRLGFEYWDKVYCAIPLAYFPLARRRMLTGGIDEWYREREAQLSRTAPNAVEEVFKMVKKHGPVSSAELKKLEIGREEYRGWKSTTAANAALDVLWNRGEIAVSHRINNRKYFDISERVIPKQLLDAEPPSLDVVRTQWLIKRVRDVGLLPLSGDAEVWASVRSARKDGLIQRLVRRHELALVTIKGVRTKCLAPANAAEMLSSAKESPISRKARFISPLDPLVWSRKLLAQLWDFDYAWEVYKPLRQRRWGYYVLPVLYQDKLAARFDGKYDQKTKKLTLAAYYQEPGGLSITHASIEKGLARFLDYLGGQKLKLPHPRKIK